MSECRLLRSAYFVGLLAALFLTAPARAQEEEYVYTAQDTLWAIDEVSVELGVSWRRLASIVSCETGGTFNPYARGRQGELGAAQLHPRGELPTFYRWGYLDPFSPYQAVRFLAQRLLQGAARAWSCA